MPYEIVKIPWTLESPYSEMSKDGAKEFFEWLTQNAEYRVAELGRLIKSSATHISLDCSPESLLPLGYWLRDKLTIRKRTESEMKELVKDVPDWVRASLGKRDTELTPESFSIAFDVAIYFSLVLMRADKRIAWKMHTKAGKLDADRNQLILVGNGKVHHNPIRSVQIVCSKMAKGEYDSTRLHELYESWTDSLVDS